MTEAVNMATDHARSDARIIVADVCPDEGDLEALATALSAFDDVLVLDHHDWSESAVNAVESVGRLVHDSTKCATQLVRDEFFDSPPAYLDEFADVTADHDLWIKEHERSDDLADFQFWGDSDEYVATARELGADIIEDDDAQRFLEENRWEKNERIRLSIEGADETVSHDDCPVVQTGADWIDVEFDSTTISVEREWYEENVQPKPADTLVADGGNRVMMEVDGPLSVAFLYGEMYASGAGQAAQDAEADVTVIVPLQQGQPANERRDAYRCRSRPRDGRRRPSPRGWCKARCRWQLRRGQLQPTLANKGRDGKRYVLDAIETALTVPS
jgi:hypothetical protein